MYFCNNCENHFGNPKEAEELIVNFGFGRVTHFKLVSVCPFCGIDDFEELQNCSLCGQLTSQDSGHCHICTASVSLKMHEVIKRIQDQTGADRDDVIEAMGHWVERQ